MTRSLVHYLEDIPFRSVITSVSALDMYFNLPEAKVLHVSTEADLIGLTKSFDGLEYPGIDGIDCGLRCDEGYILFTCVDSVLDLPRRAFTVANIAYDPAEMKYLDRTGAYPDLRRKVIRMTDDVFFWATWKIIAEAAMLLSRYDFSVEEGLDLRRLAPGEYAEECE